jgi:hypothetical protein
MPFVHPFFHCCHFEEAPPIPWDELHQTLYAHNAFAKIELNFEV